VASFAREPARTRHARQRSRRDRALRWITNTAAPNAAAIQGEAAESRQLVDVQ
jgi:hypothetical protein